MNRKFTLVVACALISLVAWLGLNPSAPQAAYQGRVEAQRWEYAMVSINAGIQEINRYGGEGWEMCGVMGTNAPSGVLFFKRPIR